MTDMNELIAQRNAIDKQIDEIKQQERTKALKQVRELVKLHGFKGNDVFAKDAHTPKKAPQKYRDPQTGKTWSGRGMAPKWIDGKDKAAFLINE